MDRTRSTLPMGMRNPADARVWGEARSQPKSWACFERHLLQRRPSAEVAGEPGLTAAAVNVNCSRILAPARELCVEYLEGLADGLEPLPRRL